MRAVQTEAESDAQQSAYRGEQSGKQAALERECWDIRDGKRDGLSAHKSRDKICDERGHDAREQTCIVNDTDADNTEGKNGGGYRRSEKRGEHGAHAAHSHDMHIFFIEAGYFAYQSRDAAAELKSRALSSGGAAEEVRYNS